MKLASGLVVGLAQFYWGGWCDEATGHEYLLPIDVADRFVRFWNRQSIVDQTEKFWVIY